MKTLKTVSNSKSISPALAAMLGLALCVAWAPQAQAGHVSPTTIVGLELWLDADDASTFDLTGAEVNEWRDKSGLTNTGVPGTKPTRVLNAINGRAAVDFSGGNDSIKSNVTGTAPSSGTPVHLIGMAISLPTPVSAANTGQTVLGLLCDDCSGATPFVSLALGAITGALTDEIISLAGGDLGEGRAGWTDPTASMSAGTNILMIHHEAGLGYQISLNGTPMPMSYSAQEATFISEVVSITLGKRDADSNVLYDGLIGELLVYNTAVSGADRADLTAYLNTKWGVAPIPEPTTFALSLLGLAGLGMFTWRRRRR